MNKTLKDILHSATGRTTTPELSVDSIVFPIISIGAKLRDLSKTKADEAGLLQDRIAEMQQEIRDLLDESDHAFRIAEQLDGLMAMRNW